MHETFAPPPLMMGEGRLDTGDGPQKGSSLLHMSKSQWMGGGPRPPPPPPSPHSVPFRPFWNTSSPILTFISDRVVTMTMAMVIVMVMLVVMVVVVMLM